MALYLGVLGLMEVYKANIKRRSKSQLRVHHLLSNNQNISMFISIEKYDYKPTPYIIARIGLAIAKNRRGCNDWYECRRNKRTRKITLRETGRCGLEGLLWAKQTLREVEAHLLEKYQLPLWIRVGWEDEQRSIVYSRLKRDGYYLANWNREDCLVKTLRDYSYKIA